MIEFANGKIINHSFDYINDPNTKTYEIGGYYMEPYVKNGKLISKRPNGRIRVQTIVEGESLTQQQFKDDCDVNLIMAKFMKTGQVTHWNSKSGVYGDFTEIPSYHEAMQTITQAQDAFMQLPAEVRLKFNNDPQQLMDYLNDPQKVEESVKLGLREWKKNPEHNETLEEIKDMNKHMKESKKPKQKTNDEE